MLFRYPLLSAFALVAAFAAVPCAHAEPTFGDLQVILYQQRGAVMGRDVSFDYVRYDDFVRTDLTLSAADLLSAAPDITSVEFLRGCLFSPAPCDEITLSFGNGESVSLSYAENAFTTVGAYLAGDVSLEVNRARPGPVPGPVPEPASLALFGAGLLGLSFARRLKAPGQV